MKNRAYIVILLLGLLLIVGLSACVQTGAAPTVEATAPTAKSTTLPYPLATPYAQQPAAGICATFEGEVVTVTLNADVPDPRCAKVRPDQTLKLINNTASPLSISIGPFKSALLAANSYSIDVPFGDYLEPGVHQVQVLPCCSVELWLVEQ